MTCPMHKMQHPTQKKASKAQQKAGSSDRLCMLTVLDHLLGFHFTWLDANYEARLANLTFKLIAFPLFFRTSENWLHKTGFGLHFWTKLLHTYFSLFLWIFTLALPLPLPLSCDLSSFELVWGKCRQGYINRINVSQI